MACDALVKGWLDGGYRFDRLKTLAAQQGLTYGDVLGAVRRRFDSSGRHRGKVTTTPTKTLRPIKAPIGEPPLRPTAVRLVCNACGRHRSASQMIRGRGICNHCNDVAYVTQVRASMSA